MERSTGVRLVVLVLVLGGALYLAGEYRAYQATSGTERFEAAMDRPLSEREPMVAPRNGTTVVTTQSVRASMLKGDDGDMIVYDAAGRVRYFDDDANDYWDVDPLPGSDDRIVYVATYPNPGGGTLNAIETVDLETGEVRRLYTNVTTGGRWHDVDRLSPTEYAVADIARDSVQVVNVSTGETVWTWDARDAYPPSAGGDPDGDWTHMNDVEQLPDGDILASVRNMDQVVRIDRETGVVSNWTLGSDDAHGTLHEQHNPDYIAPENGGPSLLVADSDNDRIVEYHRTEGEWERTWTYSAGLSWPRDADRLPNGHTLITDTRNDRVIEVDGDGEVVWSVPAHRPYEAERLETGPESADGPAVEPTGAGSGEPSTGNSESDAGGSGGISPGRILWTILPAPLIAAVRWILPPWMHFPEMAVLGGLGVTVAVWAGWELSVLRRVLRALGR
ncbi:aryl-sulfate sulfotransferase [Salinirubellus sp. GCM10025818]|uniref:aryl-sulfate sulfotransferase n=1 Tax=Salinirubellus TaxID=2162630 RepID=UPI0030D52C42